MSELDDRLDIIWKTKVALGKANERIRELEAERDALRRIAWLIGSIYVHGGFVAETANERELEKLLREQGTFWETLGDFDAAIAAKEPNRE